MKKLLLLIFTSIFIISCKNEQINLTFNLEAGKSYRQVTNVKSFVIQNINGQELNVDMALKATNIYFVEAVSESGYDITVEYENMTMTMYMPQNEVEFSSEKEYDANDIVSSMLRSIKGKKFNIKMDKQGKVMAINGVEALWESMTKELALLPKEQAEQLKKQIIDSYGGDALKGNLEMVTAIYPEIPVKKGDKWNIQTKLATLMEANISTDYELVDITDSYALIKGTSTIEPEDKSDYKEQNGMLMKFNLKGTMQSEIKVGKTSGWIIEAKINQEMNGNTMVKPNKDTGLAEELVIPMTVRNETLITN